VHGVTEKRRIGKASCDHIRGVTWTPLTFTGAVLSSPSRFSVLSTS
jgi:hypothetical protein